jgi:hypothetical protein
VKLYEKKARKMVIVLKYLKILRAVLACIMLSKRSFKKTLIPCDYTAEVLVALLPLCPLHGNCFFSYQTFRLFLIQVPFLLPPKKKKKVLYV